MKLTIGIVIQARLDSHRFPGKVMKNILGRPMMWHVIERCKRFCECDSIVLATSSRSMDNGLVEVAKDCKVNVYTGDVNDVLDRYYRCAAKYKFDSIVRITADCPLIDPEIASMAVESFLTSGLEYVRTGYSFPDGLSVEVFSFNALERTWKSAKLPSEREHVTPYMIKNPNTIPSRTIQHSSNLSRYRFTVDYEEDLLFVTQVYEALYHKNKNFGLNDVLKLLEMNTGIARLMPTPKRDEGYKRSLAEDKRYLKS